MRTEPRNPYVRRRPEESVLYGVVQAELEGLLAYARARNRGVPRFVERELRAFLSCGIRAHGFVRVRCDACVCERLVAFSCKGRGFCPSCGGRRMADTAAYLVDRVLPEVPIRQCVLSLPFALRHRLAYDGALAGADRRSLQCGAVTFVQRFGDAPHGSPPLGGRGVRRNLTSRTRDHARSNGLSAAP